jgi:hypothetical protein
MKRTLIAVALDEGVPVIPSARYGLGRCIVCKRRFFVAESMWGLYFEWFEGEPDESGEVEGDERVMPLCHECADKSQEELTAFAVDFFERCNRKARQ